MLSHAGLPWINGGGLLPLESKPGFLFSMTNLSDTLSSAFLSIMKWKNTFIREHSIVSEGFWGRWVSFKKVVKPLSACYL